MNHILPRKFFKWQLHRILFQTTYTDRSRHAGRFLKLFYDRQLDQKTGIPLKKLCAQRAYIYPESEIILKELKITPDEFYKYFPTHKL